MRLCAVAILRGTSAEPRAPATMTAPWAVALSSPAAQARVAHPTSHSKANAKLQWRNQCLYPTMWLILLEAALALALLVFIVWWTMFDKPKKKD